MAELIRGDPENLEGLVLVLGKSDKHDPPYIGYIASYNQKRIQEIVEQKCGKEKLNLIVERNARHPMDAVSTKYYRFSCSTHDKDLDIPGMDVIFAGEFKEETERHKAVENSLRQYMIEFEEKLKPVILLTEVDMKNSYKDVAVEKLADYVSKNYIEPLKHARKANDSQGAAKIEEDLRTFSAGSDFINLILGICRLVKNEMDKKQDEILNLAIREMESVAGGEYEQAAKCRDAIREKSKVLIS